MATPLAAPMNRPASTGNQVSPKSRERNSPPQALGSCAAAGQEDASSIATTMARRNTDGFIRMRKKMRGAERSAPRTGVYYLRSGHYFLRDFSPGARAISARRAPFMPTQAFLVIG